MHSPSLIAGAALSGAAAAVCLSGGICGAGSSAPAPPSRDQPLRFGLNGEWHTISAKDAAIKGIGVNTTLIEYLRESCRLTGTKLGCGVGGCGVCTVMISRRSRVAAGSAQLEHRHVNSCLLRIAH